MEAQIQNDVPKFVPVCHVCKSQDETLRDVTFPFVFSIVFMTFRRAFSGVYCKKHRRRYLFLASFITSVFGWLGIPFGFVFTPTVLVTLARGGIQNPKANFELLVALADKKQLTGDTEGAIRCLEESLRFEDNPEIRRRLSALYQTNQGCANFKASNSLKQIGGVFVALFASSIIGISIGILDLLIGDLLAPLYGSNSSLIVAILSWAPFVLMMFMGLLAIQSMIGAYFTKNKLSSKWLAIAFGSVASFTAFYNIAEIQAIIRNITRVIQAFSYSSQDGFFAVRSILSSGTIFLAANNYEFAKLGGIIYIVLVLGGLGLCVYASIMKGLDIVQWQRRLAQIREAISNREETSLLMPWATLGGMVFIALFAVVLLFPGRLVNIEKAFVYNDQAIAQGNANHYEEALQLFEKSAELWPDSAMTHSGLGIGYVGLRKIDQAFTELKAALDLDPNSLAANLFMGTVRTSRGEFKEAIEAYKAVAAAQPKWALPHSLLGILYYEMDEIDLSAKEIQTALTYAEKDGQANSIIADYYVLAVDYPSAEKYILQAINLSNNPADKLYLARIYISQNKLTQAEIAIEDAERIGANPSFVSNTRAVLAEYRNDYAKAESIISTALKTYPNDSALLSELSFIDYKSGQFDKAVEDAQKAIDQNPYEGIAYVDLAFAYQTQGKTTEALTAARKGLAFMPKYDRVHYILGLCYMESGMKVEAIQEFETFLKLYWARPIAAEEKQKAEQFLKQLK